jgi:toxin YxiD
VPSDFPTGQAGTQPSSTATSPNNASRERGQDDAKGDRGAARYDLSKDEQRGGHTLDKHVGRTDDQLRERLDRERNISAASTWNDRDAAEQTVGEALRQEQAQIERWEARGERRPNLALHFDAGRVIGRSMRHGDSTSSPCTRAVIVLKTDGENSFYVLTTYPEEER